MKLNQKLFSVSMFCGLCVAREFILPQRRTKLQQNNLPVPCFLFLPTRPVKGNRGDAKKAFARVVVACDMKKVQFFEFLVDVDCK
jgi:hypothetical protein